ncbi:hypothetical protein AB2L28_06070 [Kineococcus sp. TBRC 1896]|uniref:Uncharacterized protein n=1 Tax=Kineococcus mangrovi TaxID=1660183 RepID=A0ABV4I3L9_9ACTN
MGVRRLLGRWAVRRCHVLVVEVPGAAEVRVAVQAEVARRSWVEATSPADADVLVVCGDPGPRVRAVVANVWDRVPGPRTRVDALTAQDVAPALDAAVLALLDDAAQRADAASRPGPQQDAEGPETDADGDMDGDMGGDMDMDMDMAGPGGIPLAGGGDDRDGLEMDVLHVRLGPVLPHWPAGLVLDCALQGDVVVHATAELLEPARVDVGSDEGSGGAPARRDARRAVVLARCDAVARLLAVAGWDAAAAEAGRLRDAALAGAALNDCAAGVSRLRRRVTRSRALRWTVRGLRTATRSPDGTGAEELDLVDRLHGWLDDALVAARADDGSSGTPLGPQGVPPTALPALVTGLDLGSVRLVVAGTDVVADLAAAGSGRSTGA